jgi:hypothetical protein
MALSGRAEGEPDRAQGASGVGEERPKRGHHVLPPRGEAPAPPLPRPQEDQETIGAYGVEAGDVGGLQGLAIAQSGEGCGEVLQDHVVGGPAELALLPARAPEVRVENLHRALRLEKTANVFEDGGQRGQPRE